MWDDKLLGGSLLVKTGDEDGEKRAALKKCVACVTCNFKFKSRRDGHDGALERTVTVPVPLLPRTLPSAKPGIREFPSSRLTYYRLLP